MAYPHRLDVKEIPVPKGMIQVRIESDIGKHTHLQEYYADPKDFLEFWKPLVEYYEGVKRANSFQQ